MGFSIDGLQPVLHDGLLWWLKREKISLVGGNGGGVIRQLMATEDRKSKRRKKER